MPKKVTNKVIRALTFYWGETDKGKNNYVLKSGGKK